MVLSDEHKAVVINKINQVWRESKKCTVCGEEKWSLSDKLFSIAQFGPDNQTYPAVILTRGHCAIRLCLMQCL